MDELKLICTVGLPRSGKSTWAEKMREERGWPTVNPDAVRYALHGQRYAAEAEPMVWVMVTVMIRALFGAGHKVVVLDATGNTRKRRDATTSKNWVSYYKVIDTPKDVCLDRARNLKNGADEVIIPVIERMAEQHEPLEDDERVADWC